MIFLINEMRQITHGNTATELDFEREHYLIVDDSKGLMADFWPFSFACARCSLLVKYDRPNKRIDILKQGKCQTQQN